MKITDVQVQKNDTSKVSVFIDGKYAFSLDEVDALVMGIKKDREIDREKLSEMLFASGVAKAKRDALSLLSRKSATKSMIEDRLREKNFEDEVIETVLLELESLGLVDDYAYSALFAEYAVQKFWGERKIRYELYVKGVDKEVIEDVLSKSELIGEEEIARAISEKYRGLDLTDIKTKQKIQRFFVSRGFNFDEINGAIGICLQNTRDDNSYE